MQKRLLGQLTAFAASTLALASSSGVISTNKITMIPLVVRINEKETHLL